MGTRGSCTSSVNEYHRAVRSIGTGLAPEVAPIGTGTGHAISDLSPTSKFFRPGAKAILAAAYLAPTSLHGVSRRRSGSCEQDGPLSDRGPFEHPAAGPFRWVPCDLEVNLE